MFLYQSKNKVEYVHFYLSSIKNQFHESIGICNHANIKQCQKTEDKKKGIWISIAMAQITINLVCYK